ncbi:unnamed protein product, partial [Prorocentrum cordatum]
YQVTPSNVGRSILRRNSAQATLSTIEQHLARLQLQCETYLTSCRPPPPLPHWARRRRSRRASRAPACRGSSGEVARRRKGRRAAGSEATRHPGKCMHSARHPGTSPPAAGEGVPRPRLPRAVRRTKPSWLFRLGAAPRGGRRMCGGGRRRGRGRGRRRRGGCDLLLHSPPRGRRALAPARPRGRCCHTASSPGSGRHLPLVARSRWRRRGCIVRVLLSWASPGGSPTGGRAQPARSPSGRRLRTACCPCGQAVRRCAPGALPGERPDCLGPTAWAWGSGIEAPAPTADASFKMAALERQGERERERKK